MLSILTLHKNQPEALVTLQLVLAEQSQTPDQWIIQSATPIPDEVKEELQKMHPVPEIYEEADSGLYDGLNRALEKTNAQAIIGVLHCGDALIHAEVLAQIQQCFAGTCDLQWLSAGVEVARSGTKKRRWIPQPISSLNTFLGNMPPHPGVFFRKTVLDVVGTFVPTFRISGDYHWLLRLMRANLKHRVIPEIWITMGAQTLSKNSGGNLLKKAHEDSRAFSDVYACPLFFGYLVWGLKVLRKVGQFLG